MDQLSTKALVVAARLQRQVVLAALLLEALAEAQSLELLRLLTRDLEAVDLGTLLAHLADLELFMCDGR